MNYKKINPSKTLSPYVESIWIQEDSNFDPEIQPTRIIPSTKTDMIFYYGDPFQIHINGKKEILPLNVLHGQLTKLTRVSATGKTGLIIFSFYPWGFSNFIDIPLNEIADKSIDLKEVFPYCEIEALHQKILESVNNIERVDLIQTFLINKLRIKKQNALSLQLANIINKSNGKINLNEISQKLNISRRHLQRRFSETTGLSPKHFARIIRFQKALYLKRNGYVWSDIAELCGFYDQPHFIKEMNSFAGTTPDKIYNHVKQTKLMKYFNSYNSLSHFYNTVYL